MIKAKKTLPKITTTSSNKKKSILNPRSQNQRQLPFNTKGYFNPQEPYDEEYLKLKEKVFDKYRGNKQIQYVMIDSKTINRAAFIQRGCLLPLRQNGQIVQESSVMDKARFNLIKNYLLRKQRRQLIDSEKYTFQTPIINSQILQSRVTSHSKSIQRNESSRVSNNLHFKSETQF